MHAVSEYVLPTLSLCKCIWKALQLMRMSASEKLNIANKVRFRDKVTKEH